MDFGTIKNTFTNLIIESQITGDEKGKKLYKKFLKTLNEDDSLRTAYLVYLNLEKKTIDNEVEANHYLDENLSLIKNKLRGKTNIKKLGKMLVENGVTLLETSELHKHLNTLISTKKDASTIDILHESRKNVVSWLLKDKNVNLEDRTNIRENIDVQKFLTVATEKYNEKYSNITEEEKNIIKVLRSGDDKKKEELLRSIIKETISLINKELNNNIDIDLKTKLLETKEAIFNFSEYNIDSFGDDIKKIYEIKSVFVEND